MLNTKIVKAFKLTDGIDIMIKKNQQIQEKLFSFESEVDNKDKKSKLSLASNTFFAFTTTLLIKITNTGINLDYFVKQLCNFFIESKYTKIVKHKKMTLTTRKLKKIYANLWGPYDQFLLLEKIYVGLFLDEFTHKS